MNNDKVTTESTASDLAADIRYKERKERLARERKERERIAHAPTGPARDGGADARLRLDALERSGARTLVTANPGCHLQWASGVTSRDWDHEVLHLVELVDRALGAQD